MTIDIFTASWAEAASALKEYMGTDDGQVFGSVLAESLKSPMAVSAALLSWSLVLLLELVGWGLQGKIDISYLIDGSSSKNDSPHQSLSSLHVHLLFV